MSEAVTSMESGLDSAVMKGAASITVLIAGSAGVLRDALEQAVRAERGLRAVGIAENAEQTIAILESVDPDVLILDIEMEGACDVARRKSSRTNVVLLTAPEDRNQIAQAIKLGCSGIAQKQTPPKLILDGIQAVHGGTLWLDPQVAGAMADFGAPMRQKPRRSSDASILSDREHQIVQLVSQGYKNSGIAQQMRISEQTVKNHLHSIFNKIGVSDRLDLALYAVHKGWHLNGKPAVRPANGAAGIIRPFEKQR